MNTSDALEKISAIADKKSVSLTTFTDRIITVSTSFLAFSITFRGSLMGDSPSHLWLLKLAWISLAISSVCGVFTHRSTASAADRLLAKMKTDIRHGSSDGHPVYGILYHAMCVSFPIGIIALMVFGVINTN